MAIRTLLPRNRLDEFANWIVSQGWEVKPVKGKYEAFRAKANNGRLIILFSGRNADNLTVQNKDEDLVQQFITETGNE